LEGWINPGEEQESLSGTLVRDRSETGKVLNAMPGVFGAM